MSPLTSLIPTAKPIQQQGGTHTHTQRTLLEDFRAKDVITQLRFLTTSLCFVSVLPVEEKLFEGGGRPPEREEKSRENTERPTHPDTTWRGKRGVWVLM